MVLSRCERCSNLKGECMTSPVEQKEALFNLTLTAKERDALLFAWGVIVSAIVGDQAGANEILHHVTGKRYREASLSLTDKLSELQTDAIEEKIESIQARIDQLFGKD